MDQKGKAGRRQDKFRIAVSLFICIFVMLTLPTGLFLIDWRSFLAFPFFVGFELLFVGLAHDISEAILALSLSPLNPPKQFPLKETPPVALLITLCDDVIPSVLERLPDQTYPNYAIFVLDDSSTESQRALVDSYGYHTIRRGGRRAFKAGNLNNWLDQYGSQYKYFVILDSDSKIPDDFIMKMVEYAEHTDNRHIAIFQSKILPWNVDTKFSRIIGGTAQLRLYILSRVENQIGTLLSWGHNNLNRTSIVMEVGGFNEVVTAEDTSSSLLVSAWGYCTRLVDVVSYDTEPRDLFHYTQRTIRWARQTVEVFNLPWHAAQYRLKLLLCFHLYSYLIPSVYMSLLLLSAWSFSVDHLARDDFMAFVIASKLYSTPWFQVLIGLTALWVGQVGLRLIIARKAGVSMYNYLMHSLLSSGVMYFGIFQVCIAMLRTGLGEKPRFMPTNRIGSNMPTFQAIAVQMLPTMIFAVLVLAGMYLRNRYLLFSPNALWIALCLAAPFILWYFGCDAVAREKPNEF